jgi:hypothetical protein
MRIERTGKLRASMAIIAVVLAALLGDGSNLLGPRLPGSAPAGSYAGPVVGVAWAAGTWVRTMLEGSGQELFGPSNGVILALEDGGRLHRSDDEGTTWRRIVFPRVAPSASLPNGTEYTARVLTVDPTSHAVLYIAIADGIYKSEDDGATWRRVFENRGGGGSDIQKIAVSPADPSVVYVSVDAALIRSRDGGDSWHELQYPASRCDWRAESIIPHPTDPMRVFATFGCQDVVQPLRSLDQGESWSPFLSEIPGRRMDLRGGIGPRPERWYLRSAAGLHRSDDDGVTWTHLVTDRLAAMAYDPAAPDVVYISEGLTGVNVSRDGGASWQPVGDDISAVYRSDYGTDIRSLLLGAGGRNLYAMTNKGVYRLALE